VEELARMIEEDRLPAEMLRDLGTNREALRDFVERYRQANRSQPEGAVPEGAEIVRDGGRVMQGAQAAAPDVAARDALSAESARDALRSRFEGASERLSPRYREVVDRYYRMLSEER
jgi:DNA-directed RNA polymerase specialized sigma24 family protein